jgi:hypothetical protein
MVLLAKFICSCPYLMAIESSSAPSRVASPRAAPEVPPTPTLSPPPHIPLLSTVTAALAVMAAPFRPIQRWAGEVLSRPRFRGDGGRRRRDIGGVAGRGRGLSASTGSTTRKGWCAADALRAVVLYAASIRSRVSTKFWTG